MSGVARDLVFCDRRLTGQCTLSATPRVVEVWTTKRSIASEVVDGRTTQLVIHADPIAPNARRPADLRDRMDLRPTRRQCHHQPIRERVEKERTQPSK